MIYNANQYQEAKAQVYKLTEALLRLDNNPSFIQRTNREHIQYLLGELRHQIIAFEEQQKCA